MNKIKKKLILYTISTVLMLLLLFYGYYGYTKVENMVPLVILCILTIFIVLVLELIIISVLTKPLKMAINNELRSHLFALQSQMNLHFWHNILGMLSLDAQVRKDYKTKEMCSRLRKMLSFSSHMGDGFCSLGEERHHVDNYLSMMKERYEDTFEYTVEIPKSMNNIRVPKFILQPLCENAFNHAFIEKQPIWTIHIKGYIEEDNWYLEICDNGSGFEEDVLIKINSMKNSFTIDNAMEQMGNLAIGGLSIPNVYMRLLLSYKDKLTFKLGNTDVGAMVILGGKIQ